LSPFFRAHAYAFCISPRGVLHITRSKIDFSLGEIVLYSKVGGTGVAISSYEIKCDGLQVLSPNGWLDSLSANHLDSYKECVLDGMDMHRMFDIQTDKALMVDITGFTFKVRARPVIDASAADYSVIM
jgi:hypothetical protein